MKLHAAAQTADVLATARARMSRRSTLFHWLLLNLTALETNAARQGMRLDMPALASVFAEMGLHDRNGRPASVATLRKTLQRVRQQLAKERRTRLIPPVVAMGQSEGLHADRPKIEIRPAISLDSSPAVTPRPELANPAAPSATEAAGSGKADNGLQRVLEAMERTANPIPKLVERKW